MRMIKAYVWYLINAQRYTREGNPIWFFITSLYWGFAFCKEVRADEKSKP